MLQKHCCLLPQIHTAANEARQPAPAAAKDQGPAPRQSSDRAAAQAPPCTTAAAQVACKFAADSSAGDGAATAGVKKSCKSSMRAHALYLFVRQASVTATSASSFSHHSSRPSPGSTVTRHSSSTVDGNSPFNTAVRRSPHSTVRRHSSTSVAGVDPAAGSFMACHSPSNSNNATGGQSLFDRSTAFSQPTDSCCASHTMLDSHASPSISPRPSPFSLQSSARSSSTRSSPYLLRQLPKGHSSSGGGAQPDTTDHTAAGTCHSPNRSPSSVRVLRLLGQAVLQTAGSAGSCSPRTSSSTMAGGHVRRSSGILEHVSECHTSPMSSPNSGKRFSSQMKSPTKLQPPPFSITSKSWDHKASMSTIQGAASVLVSSLAAQDSCIRANAVSQGRSSCDVASGSYDVGILGSATRDPAGSTVMVLTPHGLAASPMSPCTACGSTAAGHGHVLQSAVPSGSSVLQGIMSDSAHAQQLCTLSCVPSEVHCAIQVSVAGVLEFLACLLKML